jgi:hypothetical protein
MAAGIYRIDLDRKWSLEEFYEIPHVFSQLYSSHYIFLDEEELRDTKQLARAFSSYPWQGGFSAVNFYRMAYGQVPLSLKPDVKSVRYESPEWLDVHLLLEAAIDVGKAVGALATATLIATKAYNKIYKGLQDRKLLRIQIDRKTLRLTRETLAFIEDSSQTISDIVEFRNRTKLNMLTNDPLTSLKILMSYYRRDRKLVEYEEEGKAHFPPGGPPHSRGTTSRTRGRG